MPAFPKPSATETVLTKGYGFWWDDTVTPLSGAGLFTGATRDLVAQVSGGGASSNHVMKEFRALAVSDVPGKLFVEVSRDNSTWRRAYVAPTSQVDATDAPLYVAEIAVLPATRYARVAFLNGAGAQSHLTVQTLAMAT